MSRLNSQPRLCSQTAPANRNACADSAAATEAMTHRPAASAEPAAVNRTCAAATAATATASKSAATLLLELAGLVVLLLSIWMCVGDGWLLHRSLWMDEVHTWLLVTDPDASHALQALADGVDFNPPAYYLVARMLSWLPGPLTELRLRGLSAGLMVSALAACYVLLRRRYARLVALSSVLLVASCPVVIHQCTEIRFYALWLAAICWLAVLLDCSWNCCRSLRVVFCLILTGLICTTHYFGVISVGLLLLGHGIFHLPRLKSSSQRVDTQPGSVSIRLLLILAITSLLSVGACLPLLKGQRAAISRPTWITAPTFRSSAEFLFHGLRPDVLVILWLAGLSMRRTPFLKAAVARTRLNDSCLPTQATAERPGISPAIVSPSGSGDCTGELAGRTANPESGKRMLAGNELSAQPAASVILVFMPLVLVIISWCLQPAMVPRYAIVGVAGLAVVYAWLISRVSTRRQLMLTCGIIGWCLFSTWQGADRWRQLEHQNQQLEVDVQRQAADSMLVFEDRIVWMPFVHRRPDLASRCRLITFEDSQLRQDSSLRIVQRDVGQRVAKWYPRFQVLPMYALDRYASFIAIPYVGGSMDDLRYPDGYDHEALGSWGFLCRRVLRSQTGDVAESPHCSGFRNFL